MKFVLFFLIVFMSMIYAKEKQSISVLEFKNSGVGKNVSQQVADAFSAALFETGKYNVIERSQLDQILKEQSLQTSGACTDNACMIEIGQLAGVQYLVVGSVGKLGESYTINAKLLNVESGLIESQKYLLYKGKIEELILKEIPKMVNYFIASAPTKITVDYDTLKLNVSDQKSVNINVIPEDASDEVLMKSSKSGLVNIFNSNNIKALQAGETDIVVKSVSAPSVKTSFKLIINNPNLKKEKKKGHSIGYRIFQGIIGAVVVGTSVHGYLLNSSINDLKDEYYKSQNSSYVDQTAGDIEGKINEQKIMYSIAGVGSAGFLITLGF